MLVNPALVARAIGRLHPKDLPSEPGKLVGREGRGQAEGTEEAEGAAAEGTKAEEAEEKPDPDVSSSAFRPFRLFRLFRRCQAPIDFSTTRP